MSVWASEYSSAEVLARLIDRPVRRIVAAEGATIAHYRDGGSEALLTARARSLAVLAALAHDGYRGIRRGLGRVLDLTADTYVSVTIEDVTARELALAIELPTGLCRIRLERVPVSRPYEPHEYFTIDAGPVTSVDPGRSLAPLHSSAYRERAGLIVAALIDRDPAALFALPPLMAVTGLTDACNHHCRFCFRERDPDYGRAVEPVFADENVSKMVISLAEAGVQSLRLCGEGEDTIHPHYLKYLLVARVAGMNVLQITNGSMLGAYAAVFARTVDFLRVSINGWTQADYARKHGLASDAAFGRLVDGLNQFTRAKARRPGGGPVLCLSTVLTGNDAGTFDPHDLKALVEAAAADVVILKRDDECSRVASTVKPKLVTVSGRRSRPQVPPIMAAGPEWSDRFTESASSFAALTRRCRALCPEQLSVAQPSVCPMPVQDWISRLSLGCVVRYVRAELERFVMYGCTPRRDLYGDLSSESAVDAWQSARRVRAATQDLVREPVMCRDCGWGDIFRVMNVFLGEEVASLPDSRRRLLERT